MPRCPDCHRRLRHGAVCAVDGASAPTGAALPSVGEPPVVSEFAIGELLGAGGAAAVWAATNAAGDHVAVKVAHSAGERARGRFAREVDILALLGTPCAPRLEAHGLLADGRPWIAMERLAGPSLADSLITPAIDLAAASMHADAMLASVEALHRLGIVHGDLKPENVFLRGGSSPTAAIIDFGLASLRGVPAEAAPGWMHGTLGYMAPEVLAGALPDARADVYAVGVILYELFTLRVPFAGDAAEVEQGHLAVRPPPPGMFAALPRALDDLIVACLAKEPDRRPNLPELRGMVRAAVASPAAPPCLPSSPTPPLVAGELVALAWIEAEAGPARIAAELARTPGQLVRQRGRIATALFSAARCDEPARAALAAATRLLATWGGRAALHVDRVDLERRDGRPPAAHGDAIDRPHVWLPPEPWSGLLLSRDLVDAIGDVAVVPAEAAGFFTPAGARAPAPPPLVGRAGVLDVLAASARECFAASRPAMVLLLGGPGSGKSRLVAELAAELDADHLHYPISPRPTDRIDGEALRARARKGPLAVLIDDGHLADDSVFATLEYATLGGAGAPLWILVAADGRALDQIRPGFGQRAASYERVELEALSDDAMRQLAASLLFPADYLPAAVLDRLAVLAGGNPGRLSELVRALKREGAVRPRSDRRSHQLAIEAIERVPATAAGRWEASRALDALPAELAASARVAAAFGPLIDEAELDWVEDALERDGQGSFFDARVALHALASRDLVVDRGGGSWAFASPLVQDAIYQAMPDGQRAGIHRHALGYWRGRGGARAQAAVARHAALAGAKEEALAAALGLADGAAALHRDVEAERWYSVALEHVGDQATRVRALVGLARARWRLDRAPEALADLAAARALAREVGAAELAAVLLDEAMVLDWCGDLDGSAARVEEARPLIEQSGDAGLAARLLVATGRTRWRQGHWAEALEPLAEGGARAADIETRLIALLLSGSALSWAGRLEEAEQAMAEAEKLARATDDRLHLAVLHVNGLHPLLWASGEPSERGADELRRAVQLARELGHPGLERAATHNLAEILHFAGRDGEAYPLAIRSFELQQRFMAESGPEDALLLCRIAVALGDRESAARHLAWLEAHAPRENPSPFHRALDLWQRGGEAPAWDALVHEAAALLPIEFLEILYLRAASEIDRDRVDQARATVVSASSYIHRFPSWRERFDGLGAGTAAWGTMQQRAQ